MQISTTGQPVFILIPGNSPTKRLPVPAALMAHCNIAQSAISDFPETNIFEHTIDHANFDDVLNLVGCLAKIKEKKDIPKTKESQKLRDAVKYSLYDGLQELSLIEIIKLACIIEPLDIPDKTLCKFLTWNLASAMKKNEAQNRSIFTQLPESWFLRAMQRANRIMKIDRDLIQPYTDSLQPTYSLPQLQTTTENCISHFLFVFLDQIFSCKLIIITMKPKL